VEGFPVEDEKFSWQGDSISCKPVERQCRRDLASPLDCDGLKHCMATHSMADLLETKDKLEGRHYGGCLAMLAVTPGNAASGLSDPALEYLHPEDLDFWSFPSLESRGYVGARVLARQVQTRDLF
jgi:hypothetical protein